ncbi:MAG: hypothetical protein LUQ65_15335, partial [Candidatus Helarchaeota archaeon]|nr:hypothetical protein [Candidatus Helarchaeota archaeon]
MRTDPPIDASPLEAVKSGAIKLVDAVKEGVITLNEAAESTKTFVTNKIAELKESIGESVEKIEDIPEDLFDRLLLPVLEKIQEWIECIFEAMLNNVNSVIMPVSKRVYEGSKVVYKRFFRVALGKEELSDLPTELYNQILELLGTNLDEVDNYVKTTEPYKTLLPLFETLKEILILLENIITSRKMLQSLIETYIRPVMLNYLKDLLPLEKIPVPGIEDLILNVAFDNLFNAGYLFGDPTAGIAQSMDRIVEFLVKTMMNNVGAIKHESAPAVADWSWEALDTFFTLEGIVLGSITLHPAFRGAVSAKVGQVGTIFAIIGIYLGYLNIINASANYASGGKIDQSTAEYLNGVKAGKDLTLSNSTAMIITAAGLTIQLKGGATPYEYIATALGFLMSLGGLLCAIESGNIQSDPIFAALHEIYAELGQDQDIVGGAKKNLLPVDPRIDELYAAYKNPGKIGSTPIIRVEKPWYGPEIINYCFVDREYGRQVAEDFIDETGIKGIWLSVRVRNDGLVPARIHASFFYNIDNGPLQSIYDATADKQKGDLLNPREVRDYWFQNWNLSRSEAADVCRGKYRIIAAVALEGKQDTKKCVLQNSVKIQIPPYFQFKPISLSSDMMIRSKAIDKVEVPLVKVNEIIMLSTKIKNLGGQFSNKGKLIVRWYIDEDERKYKMIAKEEYGFTEGKPFNYGDEMNINLTIDTTNLGFTPYTAKGWIRHLKAAIVKADFETFLGEEMPLFSGKQETELRVAFDAWPPELQNPKLTLSNAAPTEGQTIICQCALKNIGREPVNLRNGTLKVEEYAADRSKILKTHSPRIEFRDT